MLQYYNILTNWVDSKAPVTLCRLTVPSEKLTRTFIGLFNSFFSWFTDVSRRWQMALAVLNFGHVQSLKRPASDRDWQFSYVTLAVFCRFMVTRAESYRFLDFYGCWAGGQLVRLQPRNAPNVYKTQTECWYTHFRRFSAVSFVTQAFDVRKLGCMKTLLILKQTFLRRI